MIERLVFNLAFNAALSFGLGLAIVLLALKLRTTLPDGLRLYLLSLPFAKIVYDLIRWLPAESYVWAGRGLFDRPLHGDLSLGLGLNEFGPFLWGGLRVLGDGGARFTASVADLLAAWLQKHLPAGTLGFIVFTVSLTSALLVVRRFYGLACFARSRRERRRSLAPVDRLPTLATRWRSIEVYVDQAESGSPYTGGLWHPYICFPADAYQALTAKQRSAVLRHELAHVRRFDVIQAVAISLLGDLFWFVPGYPWLRERLEQLRELIADRSAVRLGADPAQLAGALMALGGRHLTGKNRGAVSTLVKPGSQLASRVKKLLEDQQRTGLTKRAILFSALVTGLVLTTSIGGNQGFHDGEDALPRYLSQLFTSLVG